MTLKVILPFCKSLTRNEEMHDTHGLYTSLPVQQYLFAIIDNITI